MGWKKSTGLNTTGLNKTHVCYAGKKPQLGPVWVWHSWTLKVHGPCRGGKTSPLPFESWIYGIR